MNDIPVGRREFLRIASLTALFGLSGCSFPESKPTLNLPRGVLPREFLQPLEKKKIWKYKYFNSDFDFIEKKILFNGSYDLLALGDGWLKHCPFELFQAIKASDIYEHLSFQAVSFLNTYESDIAKRILPIAFSPWVLIFRGEGDFLSRARDSWEVLLDLNLQNQIVLPNSPRLIMSLADRIDKPDALRLLRSQTKIFDDRNGLNWLISGKAKVAVLPLQTCLNTLASDPRLNIALPSQGAPLNWTVLLQSKSSNYPLPLNWIKDTWRLPLMLNLLAKGVIPPIRYSEIVNVINYLPEKYHSIYNSQAIFNSWSLSPLNKLEEKKLEDKWINSSP